MSLREITSPDEIRDTRSFSHLEWGAFLSIDDYNHREEIVLGHTPMCKNRLKSWGLYIEDGTRVAACETLERPALVQCKDGKIKSTSTFSIGAVFTPKEHRGKGYASVMMKQMASGIPFKPTLTDADIIKATGVSDVDQTLRVTPLWSDVGTFYEKFGWIGTTDLQYVFEVDGSASQNGVNGTPMAPMAPMVLTVTQTVLTATPAPSSTFQRRMSTVWQTLKLLLSLLTSKSSPSRAATSAESFPIELSTSGILPEPSSWPNLPRCLSPRFLGPRSVTRGWHGITCTMLESW